MPARASNIGCSMIHFLILLNIIQIPPVTELFVLRARLFLDHRVKVISIVETFFVLPSSRGISSVPMVILLFSSFINLRLVISATSTAVVIDRPLAFKVTSLVSDEWKLVITANT